MTAVGTPGFDGCALLVPTNRLLIFFLVELELWVGSPAADILLEGPEWLRHVVWRHCITLRTTLGS